MSVYMGTHCSGVLSSAGDVLEMSVMRGAGGSKRHSLHAVCFLDKPAMRTRWMGGNAPHKSGRCRD